MKPKIIPTIFALKEEDFQNRFEKLVAVTKELQIDFMDGKFVHYRFLNFSVVPDLKKFNGHSFEAHLMTFNPENYISVLKKKGFKKVIFHFEACHDTEEIINLARKIRKNKMEAFLAVNPETNVPSYLLILKEFDGILFMGVHPGKEHQMFIYDILERVKEVKHFNKKILIQVDGGVNTSNISQIKRAGANLFNTGSFVSESANPRKALLKLKKELKR